MNEELQWCFAKSLAGHDKETVYIIKKMDSEYAYLTDGKNKLIDLSLIHIWFRRSTRL